MDTKWKRFSRSVPVRIVLNALLVVCIIVEMVLGMATVKTLQKYSGNKEVPMWYSYVDLFGNQQLTNKIQLGLSSVLDYAIASQCQSGETVKEKKKEMESRAGDFQYQIIRSDEKGKETTIANSKQDTDDIKNIPIYALYKGYLSGDTYIKQWKNYYGDKYTSKYGFNGVMSYEKGVASDSYTQETVDFYDEDDSEESNFSWLSVNSIIEKLCKGNQTYAKYIAQNMVNHISVYKENIQNGLYSSYLQDSKNKETMKQILYKLYDSQELEDLKSNLIDTMLEEFADKKGLDYDALEYDSSTGLVYDEYDAVYYDIDNNTSFDSGDTTKYNQYVANKEKQQKETKLQKLYNQKLTQKEKEYLNAFITKVLYEGYDSTDTQNKISIPVSAVLNTPSKYSVYIGVSEDLYNTTQGVYMKQYDKQKQQEDAHMQIAERQVTTMVAVGIVFIFILFLLFYVCGRKAGTEEIQYLVIDRWYTEIEIITIITCIISGCMLFVTEARVLSEFIGSTSTDTYDDHAVAIWGGLALIALCVIIVVQFLCSLVRKGKGKILLRQSILGRGICAVNRCIVKSKANKTVIILYVVICGVWLFIELIGFLTYSLTLLAFMQLVMVAIMVAVAIVLSRHLGKLQTIREGIKRVKNGEITYQIPTDGKEDMLNDMAKDINSLSEGLEKSVNQMLKSERLKTELISNVSHDIKTPLTSIITYVDLIKKENVQPDKVKEYVEVLDQKSQRLKVLTDDLFEAAKATSGAMSVDISSIDLGSLVNQALGEYSEKLEKADLDIRNNIGEKQFFVKADGRRAWRILENLLGNVSKYALPGSRVYVDATNQENFVELTIKNISNVELNISADELMERFTRGDQSRNTEGSGLGLDISQSLAKLQNGEFYVEIDGDLFKAILRLPKAANMSDSINLGKNL